MKLEIFFDYEKVILEYIRQEGGKNVYLPYANTNGSKEVEKQREKFKNFIHKHSLPFTGDKIKRNLDNLVKSKKIIKSLIGRKFYYSFSCRKEDERLILDHNIIPELELFQKSKGYIEEFSEKQSERYIKEIQRKDEQIKVLKENLFQLTNFIKTKLGVD